MLPVRITSSGESETFSGILEKTKITTALQASVSLRRTSSSNSRPFQKSP
jgi:hypothetical protein